MWAEAGRVSFCLCKPVPLLIYSPRDSVDLSKMIKIHFKAAGHIEL